jgi:poly-gamma-glutamate capsule biosynthesis protein CapA/YwtB (metallophosphatase superfamily)
MTLLAACGASPRELAPLGSQANSTTVPPTVDVDPFGAGTAGGAIGAGRATETPTTASAPLEAPEPAASGGSVAEGAVTTDSATTSPIAPPPPTSPPGSFSVVASGDILPHIPVVDRASLVAGGVGYDFRAMFRLVEPTIAAADLAICHLETPIAPPGDEIDPIPPDYGIPPEIVAGIASAGYDRCSLASNHAMDKGAAGIDTTLDTFDANGLGHAGMARTPDEAEPQVFDLGGVPVAHLSYTFGWNGRPAANGEQWRSNLLDADRVVADAQQARNEGARFVVVSIHWGAEGSTEVLPQQRDAAEAITASGTVDLIIGHHAHVIQPIEQINGRWVVFGMGNHLSAMNASTDCCGIRGQDGMMVRVDVAERPDGTFEVGQPQVIPTYMDRSDYTILPVNAALAGEVGVGSVGVDALTESLARTTDVVGPFIVPR